jgi:hypothetical protein
VAVTDSESSRLGAELTAANLKLAEVELVNRRLRSQVRTARASEERLQTQLKTMRNSLSWRITYPVRVFLRVIKRKKL